MQAIFGWLLGGLWDVFRSLFKAVAKGAMIYTVVAIVINQMFQYVDLFMKPFLVLAGNWWPALGGDVIVIITIFVIKFKITLKVMQATVGQK